MITEYYVSFESAKLLKEKGFDAECDYLYADGKLVRAQGYACNWNDGETLFADYKNECSAPTLQMAMKWLMELHNLFIVIDKHYFVVDRISHIASGFKYSIEIKNINTVYVHNDYKSYEEACEAGIKYCLEKLI